MAGFALDPPGASQLEGGHYRVEAPGGPWFDGVSYAMKSSRSLGLLASLLAIPGWADEPGAAVAGSDRVRHAFGSFPSRGARSDPSIKPRSPEQTVASFTLLDGLSAEAVLHEPEIAQPLFLTFDDRGRMWVVEFRQYPYPAGLKIIDVDDQFHAVYDKVPPAPPRHDRGRDRITIHEDRDGDGSFESHKTFLDGLNMATAVEFGRGGVWVLHPPYLLFYPDADRDDLPDGDPIVHLAGFGLEDTHSAANSLCWGPDGWLYGGQGSGVSSTIVRPGIDGEGDGFYFKGQAAWRYHPERRVFELFSEGGGNTFGLEFDSAGRLFTGINGANTRGFHYRQGAYYRKNFGEHGYLTNPHAFGYFEPMRHDRPVPRFSHTMVIYEDGKLGSEFEGRILAPNPLRHDLTLTERRSRGSTYETRDMAPVLTSSDPWFRPVDLEVGPDGAVYLADWYDTRLTHMDPRDNWDRERGRVYRIRQSSARPAERFDLGASSSLELVKLLDDPRKWYRRTALRLLGDRRDRSVIPVLRDRLRRTTGPRTLDALWALHQVGGLDDETAARLLEHPQVPVRAWVVRLLGDREASMSRLLAARLAAAAANDPEVQVRCQLAASARRYPLEVAMPVISALSSRGEDLTDPHLPLMLWWAVEAHAEAGREAILSSNLWEAPIFREHLLSRLARRYASEPTTENQATLVSWLKKAPDPGSRKRLLQGINEAFAGRQSDGFVAALEAMMAGSGKAAGMSTEEIVLALRGGRRDVIGPVLARLMKENAEFREERFTLIRVLGELRPEEAFAPLLQVLAQSRDTAARSEALQALGKFDRKELARDLLRHWSAFSPELRGQVLATLCSRVPWAKDLLQAVGGSGVIPKADVPDSIADRLRLLEDDEIDSLVTRYFGVPRRATGEAKAKRIAELTDLLRKSPPGDAVSGRKVFAARCAACHQLFGEGGVLGPDLTSQERSNIENMLLQIVDPNAGIREGYTLFQIETRDGRRLLGYVADREGDTLTLRDAAGQVMTIHLDEIASQSALPDSLMPEGLLDGLGDEEIRDLFAYLSGVPGPRSDSR